MNRTSILRELTARRACCEREVIIPVEIIDAIINALAPSAIEREEASLRTHPLHHLTPTQLLIWRMLRTADGEVLVTDLLTALHDRSGKDMHPNTLEVHICRMNANMRAQKYLYRAQCVKGNSTGAKTCYILRRADG